MRTTLLQPCDEANIGAGRDPWPTCDCCLGRGFYYDAKNWARTCFCKNAALIRSDTRLESDMT